MLLGVRAQFAASCEPVRACCGLELIENIPQDPSLGELQSLARMRNQAKAPTLLSDWKNGVRFVTSEDNAPQLCSGDTRVETKIPDAIDRWEAVNIK